MFNLTMEQIEKQKGSVAQVFDRDAPINRSGETLEPVIRGAKKILDYSEERNLMYRIYRGIK